MLSGAVVHVKTMNDEHICGDKMLRGKNTMRQIYLSFPKLQRQLMLFNNFGAYLELSKTKSTLQSGGSIQSLL